MESVMAPSMSKIKRWMYLY